MFKKKFKVRVVRLGNEIYYGVEYANYYFYPTWKKLNAWSDVLNKTVAFSDALEGAEEFAREFPTMGDVTAYQRSLEEMKEKYWPDTKTIIG